MKYRTTLTLGIAALGCLATATGAGADTGKTVIQIGPLAGVQHSLYEGVNTQRYLFPLIVVDYGRLYFHGT